MLCGGRHSLRAQVAPLAAPADDGVACIGTLKGTRSTLYGISAGSCHASKLACAGWTQTRTHARTAAAARNGSRCQNDTSASSCHSMHTPTARMASQTRNSKRCIKSRDGGTLMNKLLIACKLSGGCLCDHLQNVEVPAVSQPGALRRIRSLCLACRGNLPGCQLHPHQSPAEESRNSKGLCVICKLQTSTTTSP